MTYTFVYRKHNQVHTSKLALEDGADLATAIYTSQDDLLVELGADKNSPLFAIVK